MSFFLGRIVYALKAPVRYASVKIADGVPVTTVAAQLGHSKKSLTLDVYSHVLIDRAS